MAVEIWRDPRDNSVVVKIAEDLTFGPGAQERICRDVAEAAINFLATDPDVRILVNEMTKQVLAELDLLSVVRKSVNVAVEEAIKSSASAYFNGKKEGV